MVDKTQRPNFPPFFQDEKIWSDQIWAEILMLYL